MTNNGEELLGQASQEVKNLPLAMVAQVTLKRIDGFSKSI
jgi:hypothetical protein